MLPLGLLLAAALALAAWKFLPAPPQQPAESEPEIVTVSALQQIVAVSELSTFTAVYNGVADVKNEDDPTKTDYYVSYEAKVNAGIDFEKILFRLNEEEKHIRVTLPKVHITKISVDITSLDYIFLDPSKNTAAISGQAYQACEADVQAESEQEEAIFELARQNAENMVKALLRPFLEQLDAGYVLVVDWEE